MPTLRLLSREPLEGVLAFLGMADGWVAVKL
jgi:hypothetical protein